MLITRCSHLPCRQECVKQHYTQSALLNSGFLAMCEFVLTDKL